MRRVLMVTVLGEGRRRDLVVAADVPVFQLVPALVAELGFDAAATPADQARWHVRTSTQVLPPSVSLATAGIEDGATLTLSRGSAAGASPGAPATSPTATAPTATSPTATASTGTTR